MPPRPPGKPRAFDFFENYCSNFPLPGPKCRSNTPHWGPFRWSNAPTLGTFYRHKNDRRAAETPSVVEQNLYKYNKNWETLLAYLLRTNVSCKAAEIAATRSLNAQLHYYPSHSAQIANENTTTYMECDSCWVPNGHNGPARALLTRYLSNTVQQYKWSLK